MWRKNTHLSFPCASIAKSFMQSAGGQSESKYHRRFINYYLHHRDNVVSPLLLVCLSAGHDRKGENEPIPFVSLLKQTESVLPTWPNHTFS